MLDMQEVTGSIPVSPSSFQELQLSFHDLAPESWTSYFITFQFITTVKRQKQKVAQIMETGHFCQVLVFIGEAIFTINN